MPRYGASPPYVARNVFRARRDPIYYSRAPAGFGARGCAKKDTERMHFVRRGVFSRANVAERS